MRAVLILLALAGCAPDWQKPGASENERQLAQFECDRDAIARAFEATYTRLFGRTEPGMPLEIVSWRLGVRGPRPEVSLSAARGGMTTKGSAIKGHRPAWFPGEKGYVKTAVYDRYAFGPGSTAVGKIEGLGEVSLKYQLPK